ncbi:AI-2E family transporter [Flavobacterium branchiarum]|uniref:AI-2E family transporter n=1 Tax=Flavobacterium branchiarum TaxID=1114870 RepID=A0ABV5FG76_9FLAO|nr:AI-2E family transporter [Flavobacterium branchiarum]MDN3673586.1 AI-2E family transporter [Flavobacterium branchiarum]
MESIKLPFYVKLTCVLISLICIGFIFFIGKDIITTILLAFLFSVLLLPLFTLLHTKLRFPHFLASIVTVLIFVLIIIGILTFISFQISDIANDYSIIKKNSITVLNNFQDFIKANFNISAGEQKKYVENVTSDSVKNGGEKITSALGSLSDVLLDCTIIPIFIFLFLLYKKHFILFLAKVFKKEHHNKLKEILTQIKGSINNYIVGLIIEMLVVTILTSLGLYIIGVKYFILLGLITGILNMIPYIGIFIAGVLTVLASLTGTPEISIILGILIVNVIVQLIDNNILVPLIINTKVEINALFSIVGIIIGGGVAGISGMFLAIPLMAILKIIFDRIDYLEPWGYLIGNDLPKKFNWKIKKTKLKE